MNPFNKLIILNLGVNELKCFMKKGPAIFQLLKNPLSFKDRILQNLHECLQENESIQWIRRKCYTIHFQQDKGITLSML